MKPSLNFLPLLVVALAWLPRPGHAQMISIPNGDFELPVVSGTTAVTPDSWGYYASGPNSGAPRANGLTNTISQSGSQSLFLSTNTVQGAGYEAHFLLGTNAFADSSPLSLDSSDVIELTFYIRSDALDPYSGDSVARFSLEFHDSTQVGNPNVGGTGDLLALRFAADGFSTTEWVQVTLTGSPQAFSDNILLVIDSVNFPVDAYTSSSGTFYVDNVTASVVPEPTAGGLVLLGLAGGLRLRKRNARGN
jgi:hypothetical protein